LENFEMKKSLVALAALAATASFAQSSVTLYGNIDQGIYHSTMNGQALTSSGSNVGSTSLWGITATEDLGGGTKASFDLRSELTLGNGHTGSATTGQANGASTSEVFNRSAWIGIENSALGAFKVGRQNDAWWETTTKFNNTGINSFGWANATAMAGTNSGLPLLYRGTAWAAGNATVSGTAYGGAATTLAAPNASAQGAGTVFYGGLSYQTPTWMGFTAKLGHGIPKAYYDANGNANNTGSASLLYTNGDFTGAWAYNYRTDAAGEKAVKQTMLGGQYKVGAFTLTAAQNATRVGPTAAAAGDHDADILAYGVGYAINPAWSVDVGYTTMKDKIATDNKFVQTGVVAKYAFTKRTTWYVGYGHASNNGNSRFGSVYAGSGGSQPGLGATAGGATAGMLGQSDTTILTGLRHQF